MNKPMKIGAIIGASLPFLISFLLNLFEVNHILVEVQSNPLFFSLLVFLFCVIINNYLINFDFHMENNNLIAPTLTPLLIGFIAFKGEEFAPEIFKIPFSVFFLFIIICDILFSHIPVRKNKEFSN